MTSRNELLRNPHLFDHSYTAWGSIHAVLGGKFHRVAKQAWANAG